MTPFVTAAANPFAVDAVETLINRASVELDTGEPATLPGSDLADAEDLLVQAQLPSGISVTQAAGSAPSGTPAATSRSRSTTPIVLTMTMTTNEKQCLTWKWSARLSGAERRRISCGFSVCGGGRRDRATLTVWGSGVRTPVSSTACKVR